MPPAAPAPGERAACTASGPSTSPSASRSRSRPRSRAVTSAGPAPFWGPKTAAAPCSPRRGLSTSEASTIVARTASGRTPERSTRLSARSGPPPGPSSCPSASRKRAPSAVSIPAPPSVQALPPTPSTIRRAPWERACAMSSPVPWLVAPSGSSRRCPCRSRGRRSSPEAWDISITAVAPRAKRRDRPCGPVVRSAPEPAPSAAARPVAVRHRISNVDPRGGGGGRAPSAGPRLPAGLG